MENVYMVQAIGKETGNIHFVCSGKNYTPFTTTAIGRARAIATKYKGSYNYDYKVVKVIGFEVMQ